MQEHRAHGVPPSRGGPARQHDSASGKGSPGGGSAAERYVGRRPMKYGGLLFANLFRKKTRLVLTLGSFAVALFLFVLLAIVKQAFSAGVNVAGGDSLGGIKPGSLT